MQLLWNKWRGHCACANPVLVSWIAENAVIMDWVDEALCAGQFCDNSVTILWQSCCLLRVKLVTKSHESCDESCLETRLVSRSIILGEWQAWAGGTRRNTHNAVESGAEMDCVPLWTWWIIAAMAVIISLIWSIETWKQVARDSLAQGTDVVSENGNLSKIMVNQISSG